MDASGMTLAVVPAQVGNLDLDALLALGAVFLGLSLGVQVIQEVWKFVTTSKSRAYRKALIDFVGEKIDDSRKERTLGGMLLRGPFQFVVGQQPAHLLPAERGELVHAMEQTTSEEMQVALGTIRDEARRQAGAPRPPSPALRRWFGGLRKEAADSQCAKRVFDHLVELGLATGHEAKAADSLGATLTEGDFDAAAVLDSLHRSFVPEAKTIENEFDQFATNFEYAWRRRNLRQTVVIGFLLAFVLNLPLDGLYDHARSLSPEQIARMSETAVALHAAIGRGAPTSGESSPSPGEPGEKDGPDDKQGTPDDGRGNGESAVSVEAHVAELVQRLKDATELVTSQGGGDRVFRPLWAAGAPGAEGGARSLWCRIRAAAAPGNVLACLATALLLAFGAPFWHRLSHALLGRGKSSGTAKGRSDDEGVA